MYKHWFERIVPHSLILTSIGALLVWLVLFLGFAYLLDGFAETKSEDNSSAIGTSLFFASIVVYTILAGAWVIRRSRKLVMALSLTCDEHSQLRLRDRIAAAPKMVAVAIGIGSILAGVAHNMYLQGTVSGVITAVTTTTVAFGGALGTMIAWILISHTVSAFVRNAQTFAVIGETHLAVDLLQPENYEMLGRAALMPAVALVGTQALFPLLWFGGSANMAAVVPGFLIILVSVVYLFVRTTLPLHRRLVAEKASELSVINNQIEDLRSEKQAVLSAAKLAELQTLLDHRAYLQNCPEWPFRLTTIARWSLYLLIPPLSWVGAALIENLVDFFLT